jgi:1,4-alpha-glucan branching enzyme
MMERKKRGKVREHQTSNIQFVYSAPEARQVYVAGEFNEWNLRSVPLKKDKHGTWRKKMSLSPGRYEYKLIADDAWVEDLPGVEVAPNPFGTQNFVLRVPAP